MNLQRLRPLLLILALLLMQQLGMLHRYAHAPLGSSAVAALQADVGGAVDATDMGSLPAHDATQCGLLDHLCTADGVASGIWLQPVALAVVVVLVFHGWGIVQALNPVFQARAPPSHSFHH